jgi:predicted HTH domain antitoxin
VIANITLRSRSPRHRKERDLDVFPAREADDEEAWIGLSIRQPNEDEPDATVWVLKEDLWSALSALSKADDRDVSARIDWLIDQVKERRLGYGKPAELSGVPNARFIQMMGERGVSSLDYDEQDLASEVRAADEVVPR